MASPVSSIPKRPSPSQVTSYDDKPLWNHVTVVQNPGSGGNRKWTCNYCDKKVTGSYSKVKAHLLKIPGHGVQPCMKITDEIKDQIQKEHAMAEAKKAQVSFEAKRKLDYVTLPPGSDLMQPKRKKGTLESCFNVIERDELDKECARFIYSSALPFSIVKNPCFREFVLKLANSKCSGYVPPTYNRLRLTLLQQEKTHVNTLLQPFRNSWKKKGVSLCSDGWTDRQKRPLINVMAASGENSMFLKAFDTSGNLKDTDYVASLFQEIIDEEGADNIVQIITDNAGNFKAAGLSIEAKYPHIFWTPCVVHTLNLALKAICEPPINSNQYDECKWISSLMSECDAVVIFVLNHGKALTIFKNYSKLMLTKVAETRFASHVIMVERLFKVKNALEKMVLDVQWKTFRKTHLESKADTVKECVISDRWWDKIEYFLNFTTPIYNMIRKSDVDFPCLHLIYDLWDTMIEEVREKIFKHEGLDAITGDSPFFNVIQTVLEARWNKSNTPLHCMAHSLVPKYYSETWLEGGSSLVPRVAPNEDQDVSYNRDKCFKKMFTNPDELRKVNAEYGQFSGTLGFFGEAHVMDARAREDPLSWWASYGSSTPRLQALAFRLLSQPASSSCCERNWSSFSNIHSIKRNRLASSRAEDLVYVHSNLRMLSRKKEEYTIGPSSFWDVGKLIIDII